MRDTVPSELKQKLLPPKPPTPPNNLPGSSPVNNKNVRPPTPPVGVSVRGFLPSSDLFLVKKGRQGVRTWISIDWRGHCKVVEADKLTIMKKCELPARDLRLLDPLFVYPSTILGREKAIVVNLEQIRCIITSEECLLLNTPSPFVQEYKKELQRRIMTGDLQASPNTGQFPGRGTGGQMDGRALTAVDQYPHNSSQLWSGTPFHQEIGRRVLSDHDMFSGGGLGNEDQPFEFRALELALEAACTSLDSEASKLGWEAYPLLERLAFKISTTNLELVRRLKSDLVSLTRRVQKVRDEIEQLMDDDGDMAEMYLTEKKIRSENSEHRRESAFGSVAAPSPHSPPQRSSLSAPVSPVGSPKEGSSRHTPFDRAFSTHSTHDSIASASSDGSEVENVDELEMLLEAYFVVVDGTLNKLTQMSQYIEDTEDFINIQLDNVRNQLIQFELLLTTATFVVAIAGVVAGIFGMNVPLGVEEDPWAFRWILWCTGIGGCIVFCLFLLYFKYKNLTIT